MASLLSVAISCAPSLFPFRAAPTLLPGWNWREVFLFACCCVVLSECATFCVRCVESICRGWLARVQRLAAAHRAAAHYFCQTRILLGNPGRCLRLVLLTEWKNKVGQVSWRVLLSVWSQHRTPRIVLVLRTVRSVLNMHRTMTYSDIGCWILDWFHL